MANYYRGFKRIYFLLWIITSSAVLVIACFYLQPNPAMPLATIHPASMPEPFDNSGLIVMDFEGNPIANSKFSKKTTKERHQKYVQAYNKWKSELVSAFRAKSYWKNVGFSFLACVVWSVLFWCLWVIGMWVVRGFISKT